MAITWKNIDPPKVPPGGLLGGGLPGIIGESSGGLSNALKDLEAARERRLQRQAGPLLARIMAAEDPEAAQQAIDQLSGIVGKVGDPGLLLAGANQAQTSLFSRLKGEKELEDATNVIKNRDLKTAAEAGLSEAQAKRALEETNWIGPRSRAEISERGARAAQAQQGALLNKTTRQSTLQDMDQKRTLFEQSQKSYETMGSILGDAANKLNEIEQMEIPQPEKDARSRAVIFQARGQAAEAGVAPELWSKTFVEGEDETIKERRGKIESARTEAAAQAEASAIKAKEQWNEQLLKLQKDGTRLALVNGKPVAAYNNEDFKVSDYMTDSQQAARSAGLLVGGTRRMDEDLETKPEYKVTKKIVEELSSIVADPAIMDYILAGWSPNGKLDIDLANSEMENLKRDLVLGLSSLSSGAIDIRAQVMLNNWLRNRGSGTVNRSPFENPGLGAGGFMGPHTGGL